MALSYPVHAEFGSALLQALGSFWSHYFGDREKLELLLRGAGHLHGQTYLDFVHTVATLSRFDTPVFREENWYQLVLKKSDRDGIRNKYNQAGLAYDGSTAYDGTQTAEVLYPLPDVDFFGRLADVPYVIYNRILYPSRTWVRGLDFDVDYVQKLIRFREDPLLSEYVARRDVYDDNGKIVDEEIGLWVSKGSFDLDDIYRRFGFAVGLRLESGTFYKDIVNALWDGFALGPGMKAFAAAVSAMLGIPLVIEPIETVKVVREEISRKLVVTDKHVYEFSDKATVTVSVGDVLKAGESMTDAVRIIDLSGDVPDYSCVPGLSFDRSFLSGDYYAPLTFENRNVDIEYLGPDADGRTVVRFAVEGFPGDIDEFFDGVHARAKRSGARTIAEILDLRATPVTQPLESDLPEQVNPLEFLVDNIMKNNLVLIKIKAAAIHARAPGLKVFKCFRALVPPHTTFLVFVEIQADSDTMTLPDSVEESVGTFDGIVADPEEIGPVTETDPGAASYEDFVMRVYSVSEQCK